MLSRRVRILLISAGALVLVVISGAVAVFCYVRGPGLDRQADRLAALSGLQAGMKVAEIGAGEGRIAVRVAQHVGPTGRLYATELETWQLEAIRSAAAAASLNSIDVLRAGEHSTNLPDACCEVIYMRRVYHHLSDPASIDKSLFAALAPGGRLVIIDMLSPRWVFWMHHGIAPDVVEAQVASAGFQLERRVDGWSPIDYCFVFRKPSQRDSEFR